MSGLGLITDYNNDSEDVSETEEREEKPEQLLHKDNDAGVKEVKSEELNMKKETTAKEDGESNKEGSQHTKHDNNEKSRSKHRRDSRSRDDRRSDRDDRRDSRRDDRRRHDHRDRRHDDRSRRHRDERGGGRDDRRHTHRPDQEKDYEEYRRRKYGDSREWGKVSAEALKDVKTDSTLPSNFDSTIAKQLAAQREKRKLLWGKKEEGESSVQKTVWGSGSIRNDETGEQTAKFLKLMGVKDVTADNVKDYKKTDDSVLRSTEMLDSMETEYEKSRYMQHINKGIGLGLVQFKPPS